MRTGDVEPIIGWQLNFAYIKGSEDYDNAGIEHYRKHKSVERTLSIWAVRLAGLHSPKFDHQRRAETARSGRRAARRHFESVHLRKGDRRQHRLRSGDREQGIRCARRQSSI